MFSLNLVKLQLNFVKKLNIFTCPFALRSSTPSLTGRPRYKFRQCSTVMMNGEPTVKRANVETIKIGTHNGCFHCDEVLACFMLKQLPEYKDAEIIRTRDLEVLDTLDIVVDVGGVYDPSRQRFDHHQREFEGTMSSLCPGKPWSTKLSSAGLIYLHFGTRVLAEILNAKPHDMIVTALYDKVYENFIEEVDAVDNGVSICDEKPRYHVSTTLSSRVARLNPAWNEKNVDLEGQFKTAFELVGSEFLQRVSVYANSWWPARELVRSAVQERFKVDEGGEIVEFGSGGYPWKDHLFEMEDELKLEPSIKFVLFTDTVGKWRVQAVPIDPASFILRIPLWEEWRGLRDKQLDEVSGIVGCTFVHANGFIGGHANREGALTMAKVTLTKHRASTKISS